MKSQCQVKQERIFNSGKVNMFTCSFHDDQKGSKKKISVPQFMNKLRVLNLLKRCGRGIAGQFRYRLGLRF
jgi:hypothetical protein